MYLSLTSHFNLDRLVYVRLFNFIDLYLSMVQKYGLFHFSQHSKEYLRITLIQFTYNMVSDTFNVCKT